MILLGLSMLIIGATAFTLFVLMKTLVFHTDLFIFWGTIVCGPFGALWVLPAQTGWVVIGIVNLVVILIHPILPNHITAGITAFGFAAWLLMGIAIACSPI